MLQNSITNWLNKKGTPAELREIYSWDKEFRNRLAKLAGYKPRTLAEITYEVYRIKHLPKLQQQEAIEKLSKDNEFKAKYVRYSNIPSSVIIGPFLDSDTDKRSWEDQITAAISTVKLYDGSNSIYKLEQCLAYEELKLRATKSPKEVFDILFGPNDPKKSQSIEEKRIRDGYALLGTKPDSHQPNFGDILLAPNDLRDVVIKHGSQEDIAAGKRIAKLLVETFKDKIDDYDTVFPLAKQLVEQKKLHNDQT